MHENKHTINLLWTGGMDSTFRLIQLTAVYNKVVQPYYIIDPNRNSILFEIRAMESILNALFLKYPETKALIRPTIFKETHRISPNQEITSSYLRIKKIVDIGSQYDWLSRFCAEEGIHDMEICLEKSTHDDENRIFNMLMKDMDKIETTYEGYFQIKASEKGKDTYTTFGNFRFPMFDLTKQYKYEYSRNKGFYEILDKTWFCLMPTKKMNPCGKCHPCRVVYKEKMYWRLPLTAKIRYHIWPTLRKTAKLAGIKR